VACKMIPRTIHSFMHHFVIFTSFGWQ